MVTEGGGGGSSLGLLHDGPVVGLRGPDVGGGAQLAPRPLVVGAAAAAAVAVGLLTHGVRHDVGPEGERQRHRLCDYRYCFHSVKHLIDV